MSRNLPIPTGQQDLFRRPVFESRIAEPTIDLDRFRARLKRSMSAAIRESGRDRLSIATDMSRLSGGTVSKAMLNAYTSESKTTHDISVVRFKAFVRAVCSGGGDTRSLWDAVVSDDGLTVLGGDEPRLAEIARLQQEQRAIGEQLRRLRAVPVAIRPPDRPHGGQGR